MFHKCWAEYILGDFQAIIFFVNLEHIPQLGMNTINIFETTTLYFELRFTTNLANGTNLKQGQRRLYQIYFETPKTQVSPRQKKTGSYSSHTLMMLKKCLLQTLNMQSSRYVVSTHPLAPRLSNHLVQIYSRNMLPTVQESLWLKW